MRNVTKLLEISLVWLVATYAHADTVSLYAAAGVKAPSEEIIAAFERRTGHQVQRHYDTAGAAEAQMLAAIKKEQPASNLLITTQVRIDKASAAGGALQGGEMRVVGDTLAGVAISKAFGARLSHTGIELATDLKRTLLAANRIAFSDPVRGATVGVHFVQVIEQLGIKDAVLAKSRIAKDGIETMKWVASGDVDIGITQMSEILQTDPTLLLGAFPPELELATRYSSWVSADASPAARDLATAFASDAGRAALAKHGLRVPN
jgi:molybdate transport system substrate-binding protein